MNKSGIIVDIGTGDGKFVYQLAKENPDKFIIGIDTNHKNLEEISQKIYKKSSKGGLPNTLFVLADIENLPEELNGIANQIFINFPWGSLLKGIVLVEDTTWENIKRISPRDTIIDIILGYRKDLESNKVEELDLPPLNIDYLKNHMLPSLKNKGFTVLSYGILEDKDLEKYPTSWAKKLKFGKERTYYHLRLQNQV